MMDEERSSEKSVLKRARRRNIPLDNILQVELILNRTRQPLAYEVNANPLRNNTRGATQKFQKYINEHYYVSPGSFSALLP